MSRRMERVNVLLREEISQVLSHELNDPRLSSLVSVTQVDASPDLRLAKVFISVFGDETDKTKTLRALKSAAGFIRRTMRPRLSLRSVPHLRFFIDDSIEQGARLLERMRDLTQGHGV